MNQRLAGFPAVALVGPRQAGKTTLARSLGGKYFDLEQETDRLGLDLRWDALVNGDSLLVLDEAQTSPEIFPRLRGAIDRAPSRTGRFLLLGSVSPGLMTRVSESLAGRLALVEMTPFLADEVPDVPLEDAWCRGGYPAGGILDPTRFPVWQRDYLALLAQRDLPTWGLQARPRVTERLFGMLAAVHGQVWNASQVAASLGLSYHTVDGYLDHLEGAFLIRRLRPFQANLKKRLTRRPKVYWRDTGLLHALLGVTGYADLLSRPWAGASWEGFVIEQVLGVLGRTDRRVDAYFLRANDRYEIDLVLDFGRTRWAVEVRLTSSPGPDEMDRFDRTADLIGAERRILVSQTRESIDSGGRVSCDLPWLLDHLARPA